MMAMKYQLTRKKKRLQLEKKTNIEREPIQLQVFKNNNNNKKQNVKKELNIQTKWALEL